MSIKAKLADGRTLNFPDGTDPSVIQATVKKMITPPIDPTYGEGNVARKIDAPGAVSSAIDKILPAYQKAEGAYNKVADAIPGLPNMMQATNAATTATTLERGAANLVSGDKKWGDKVYPKVGNPNGEGGGIGYFLDPAGWMLGGAVGKAIPYAPLIGKGVVQGLLNLGKNAASGELVNQGINVLDEDKALGDNFGLGAGISGGLSLGTAAASKFVGGLKNLALPYLGQWGLDRATGKTMNTVLDDKADDVVNAIRNRRNYISTDTAAEAAASANSTKMSALESIADDFDPDLAKLSREAKEAQRLAPVDDIAGTKKDYKKFFNYRKEVTSPMRDTAIENANMAGKKMPELEQAIANKENDIINATRGKYNAIGTEGAQTSLADKWSHKIPGSPKFPTRYSLNTDRAAEAANAVPDYAGAIAQRNAEKKFLENQANSLWAHGNKELTADNVISKIKGIKSKPGVRSDNIVPSVLEKVEKQINAFKNTRGVIDANDLYTIRKDIGNYIEEAAGQNKKWNSKMSAGIQRKIQQEIDDAIDTAAGGGWKDYLSAHEKLSNPMNQMKVGNLLKDALRNPLDKESPSAFAAAMRRAETKIDKKSGKPIIADLTPQQKSNMDTVLEELQRNEKIKTDAASARDIVGIKLGQIKDVMPNPPLLNRIATITNAISKRIEGVGSDKVMKNLAKVTKDPERAAYLIEKMKPKERNALIEAIMNRAAVISTANSGGN